MSSQGTLLLRSKVIILRCVVPAQGKPPEIIWERANEKTRFIPNFIDYSSLALCSAGGFPRCRIVYCRTGQELRVRGLFQALPDSAVL